MAAASTPLPFDCVPGAPNWFQSNVLDELDGVLVYGCRAKLLLFDSNDGRYLGGAKAHDGRPGVTGVCWLPKQTPAAPADDDASAEAAVPQQAKQLAVSCGADSSVKLWRVDTAEKTIAKAASLAVSGTPTAIDVSATSMVAVGVGKAVLLRRVVRGAFVDDGRLDLPAAASCVSFCRCDGRQDLLCVGCTDGSIVVYDKTRRIFTWTGAHSKAVQSVDWKHGRSNGDVLFLASGGLDKRLVVWRIASTAKGDWTWQSQHLNVPQKIEQAYKQQGGAHSGQNRVWNVVRWCPIAGSEATLVTTANTAPVVLSWPLEAFFNRWTSRSTPPGQAATPVQLVGHSRSAFNFVFTRGPTPYLISTSMEKRIIKWDFRKHKPLWTIPVLGAHPSCVAVGAAGTLVLAEKDLLIWPLPAEHQSADGRTPASGNPYVHRQHWKKVTSGVTAIGVHSEERICFGTRCGDVGLVTKVVADKGKRVRHECDILASLDTEIHDVQWVGDAAVLCVGNGALAYVRVGQPPVDLRTCLPESIRRATLQAGAYDRGVLALAHGSSVSVHDVDVNVEGGSGASLRTLATVSTHSTSVACVAVRHCDGGCVVVASGDADGRLAVTLVARDGQPVSVHEAAHKKKLTCVTWGEGRGVEGAMDLVSSGVDGRIVLWRYAEGQLAVRGYFTCTSPVREVLFSPLRGDLVYAIDDCCLLTFSTAHAKVPTPAQAQAAADKKRKLDATHGGGGAGKRRKITTLGVTTADWLAGVDGENAPVFTLEALHVGDGKLAVVKHVLEGGGSGGPTDGADLGGALVAGEDLRRALEDQAATGETAALLQALAGDFVGAAGTAVRTVPKLAPFWVALARTAGFDAWKTHVLAWRAAADPQTQALIDLCVGDWAAAAATLADAGDLAGLAGVAERWPAAARAPAERAVRAALDNDIPPAVKFEALLALGRPKDAAAVYAESNDARKLRQALAVHATPATADRYAMRWLLGEDPTVAHPPDGAGGVHSVHTARLSLVLSAEQLRAEVADCAGAAAQLDAWKGRVAKAIPARVAAVVDDAVAKLRGGA